MVMVSHDPEVVDYMCDHAVTMKAGRIDKETFYD